MPDPVRRSRKAAHKVKPPRVAPREPSSRRRRAPSEPPRRRPIALDGDDRLERLTLIEFVWDISSGVQPVILASRRLLH